MRRLIALFILLLLSVGSVAGQDETFIRHRVAPGDNLYRISIRYGVSMASIQAANPIIRNRNLIFLGTTLLIPVDDSQQPPTEPPPTEPPPTQEQQYTVVRGDTLGRIASRFGSTVTAIAQRNRIANPNLIFPGQTLTIPGTTGDSGPATSYAGTTCD